ncbi:hypothetical protein J6590_028571, partial [Homalodisca vitripennis]
VGFVSRKDKFHIQEVARAISHLDEQRVQFRSLFRRLVLLYPWNISEVPMNRKLSLKNSAW